MNIFGSMYYKNQGIEKNYTKAKELYGRAVGLGNSYAMASLGFMYRNGNGIEQDYTRQENYLSRLWS